MTKVLIQKYIHQIQISQFREFYLLHILMNFQSRYTQPKKNTQWIT